MVVIEPHAAPLARLEENSVGIANHDVKVVQDIAQTQKTQVQTGPYLRSRQANPLGRGESYDPADRPQHMILSTVKRPAAVFRTTR